MHDARLVLQDTEGRIHVHNVIGAHVPDTAMHVARSPQHSCLDGFKRRPRARPKEPARYRPPKHRSIVQSTLGLSPFVGVGVCANVCANAPLGANVVPVATTRAGGGGGVGAAYARYDTPRRERECSDPDRRERARCSRAPAHQFSHRENAPFKPKTARSTINVHPRTHKRTFHMRGKAWARYSCSSDLHLPAPTPALPGRPRL